MIVIVTCNNEKDPIINLDARVFTRFSHYNPTGVTCFHRNQSSDPTCIKT